MTLQLSNSRLFLLRSRRVVRVAFMGALAALGCEGVSVGDEGTQAAPRCLSDITKVTITDLTATPKDFDDSAQVLLAPIRETLVGTLTLADGERVPLRVTMSLVPGTLKAVYPNEPEDPTCKPWLEAKLNVDLDAGDTLRGNIEGELDMRVDPQVRIGWIDVTDFDATPEVPDFGDDVSTGPAITGGLLRDVDGTWGASFEFAAHVPAAPCNEKTEMCAGAAGQPSPVYEHLGDAELASER